MSVQRVTITSADEKYAPPGKEIEVAVLGDVIFITVYEGSSDDLAKGRAKAYEVPEMRLQDLMAAITAFGTGGHGVYFAAPPEVSP